MQLQILAVGDVVSPAGVRCLRANLPALKQREAIDFTVVNGENADGLGILPQQAEDIFLAGADVITLGNHSFSRRQILGMMEDSPYLLRPANFSARTPGRGWGVYEGPRGLRIGVLVLIGRCFLEGNWDSPFSTAEQILGRCAQEADVILVDFHAEATSEKSAMAWYLDGRVQTLWGTHTHVPTADGQILPGGCGFVSDLGMCGPAMGVLGVDPQNSINRFLGGLYRPFAAAAGPCRLDCVRFTLDTEQRRCTQVKRLDMIY